MSFTEILDTKYGKMLCHKLDTGQTGTLHHTGKALAHREIDMLLPYLQAKQDPVFVDVGANIGCFSFALRPYCSKVYAFEAQRVIYNMLAGSIALNGWLNVFCKNVALGRKYGEIKVPQFDYEQALSYGSVEFGRDQLEPIGQVPLQDTSKLEYVPVYPLDSYNFPRVDAIKIDVEGMEIDVLQGASNTIQLTRPVMLIEHLKCVKCDLEQAISDLNYNYIDIGMDYLCTPQ